jgi:hypothetical protein
MSLFLVVYSYVSIDFYVFTYLIYDSTMGRLLFAFIIIKFITLSYALTF